LPFTLKCILRQKKNYGNTNISTCTNIIFKNPLKETKIFQDIITLTNLKFQHKPKYHKNRPMEPKSLKLLYSIMNLNTISLPTKARPTNPAQRSVGETGVQTGQTKGPLEDSTCTNH
jgi:hypothetical protein